MLRFSVLCISFILTFGELYSSSAGKTNSLLSTSGGCGGCHGNASSNTSVSIISKSGSFTIQPGAKAEFTAIVAHPSKTGAGINIGVKSSPTSNTNSGTLEVLAGQGLKKSSSELTHTSPKTMSSGKAEFSFTWTAPSQEGVYYLMATGNAVNRNGGDSGDEWNFMTPIQITVAASTRVHEANQISSLTVFPNPVQEYSIFQFEVDQPSEASYSIINMMGQTVFSQKLGYMTSGVHSVNFLGLSSILSSGHYLISIQASGGRQTIPFIKQ
jgi:hypothetical protein